MNIEQEVLEIIARVLGAGREDMERVMPLGDWSQQMAINDETCLALNINISALDACRCRTVDDYVELVQHTLG